MKEAIQLIKDSFSKSDVTACIFSSPRKKSQEIKKITLWPIKNKNQIKCEIQYIKHNNIISVDHDQLNVILKDHLKDFKQCLVKNSQQEIQILINKKLETKIIYQKTISSPKKSKQKKYLIPEGVPCSFLVEIGVMTTQGKVKPQYYKKFKQINRFLELVDDLYAKEEKQSLHIVDFGCGKSYLTFALYYYFTCIKKHEVIITGIDLKQDVIDHCNHIAQKLNYNSLKFVHGFIHSFKSDLPIDFVVTLHACDTATDDAILFSLQHKVEKMMFVPCCQHELNKQLYNKDSKDLLKHGIFRDKMTSLITDSMRSQLLQICGYKVQCMEFIELEHTAKNILLRCQKTHKSQEKQDELKSDYLSFKKYWNISPYLESELLRKKFISLN
ncbi:MAG: SAM-dependent methyltransferase [Bacteriovoracaceae bacterium]|jgi:hypothetical protein|nr:SAM-dependent methyltransferase [Bacteriovoracaceae bacterium]